MVILGIETSCDETSAAIVKKKDNTITLRSNIISSSLEIHAKTGGIIPENAAREQIKYILPVIQEALTLGETNLSELDAIAIAYGPGLIGSLLVGIETVKTIAYVNDIPIIPINHMVGHIYANWIENKEIHFPIIGLVVSGGHTDLLLIEGHENIKLLGGTRDDAAGEAFDKIARLLGLKPVGVEIEKAAKMGDPKKFRFPRPLIGSGDFDFSFSGLKTAVLRETQNTKALDTQTVNDIAYAAQEAIVDVLVKKTLKAAVKYNAKSILISGGVAANQKLRETFELMIRNERPETRFFAPPKNLCTDNAAMIASAACFNFQPVSWNEITADPELYFN